MRQDKVFRIRFAILYPLYVKKAEAKGRTREEVDQVIGWLTGYSAEEAVGKNPRILQSGRHSPEFYREMWTSINTNGHWHGDIWDRRKDGTVYPKFLSITAIRDDTGTVTHYSSIFSDVTERKRIEEKLSHLAHHDALTKLPNRTLFETRLGQAMGDVVGSTDLVAIFSLSSSIICSSRPTRPTNRMTNPTSAAGPAIQFGSSSACATAQARNAEYIGWRT